MEPKNYLDLETEPLLHEKELTQILSSSTIGYVAGTVASYSAHAIMQDRDDVTSDISADDNFLNAAAVVCSYVVIRTIGNYLSNRENRVLRWVGEKTKKYAGLLAIVPAVTYEIIQARTGNGIHPDSASTPGGTYKDSIAYVATGVSLFTFDRLFDSYTKLES